MTTVRVGGMVFQGGAGTEGFFISADGFDGWDDGVDVRRDSVQRPQAHGSYDVLGFLDSRVVSISGICLATSAEQLAEYGNQLTGLLSLGFSGQVVVETPSGTLTSPGRLASKTKFDVVVWGSVATYQVQFWFADPRKYGDSRAFADGTPSWHRGNFAAIPTHTVTGSMGSGYTINGPQGKKFTVSAALASGHPHTIDMATGSLTVDGSPVYGAVTHGDTWVVNAGTQVTHTLTGSGTGSLSTSMRDTFI